MTARFGLLPALASLALVLATTPACAQGIYGGRDRGYGYGIDVRRVAYDNGYRRGFENGERDGRSGRYANYRDDRVYRDADWGYDRRFGPRGQYRQVFRDGYEVGYRDGYARNTRGGYGGYGTMPRGSGRYPEYGYPGGSYPRGGYGYADVARDYGYREGLEKGRDDARGRKAYDPRRQKWYREGDRHYESRYGSRDVYMRAYREAFLQGYDQGYRGGYR